MSLALRNVLFTLVVPGAGAVGIPWWILTRAGTMAPVAWYAVAVIGLGAALYLWCLWIFATVGSGTPGPWDAQRRASGLTTPRRYQYVAKAPDHKLDPRRTAGSSSTTGERRSPSPRLVSEVRGALSKATVLGSSPLSGEARRGRGMPRCASSRPASGYASPTPPTSAR
jgi:hypothetical protein